MSLLDLPQWASGRAAGPGRPLQANSSSASKTRPFPSDRGVMSLRTVHLDPADVPPIEAEGHGATEVLDAEPAIETPLDETRHMRNSHGKPPISPVGDRRAGC